MSPDIADLFIIDAQTSFSKRGDCSFQNYFLKSCSSTTFIHTILTNNKSYIGNLKMNSGHKPQAAYSQKKWKIRVQNSVRYYSKDIWSKMIAKISLTRVQEKLFLICLRSCITMHGKCRKWCPFEIWRK